MKKHIIFFTVISLLLCQCLFSEPVKAGEGTCIESVFEDLNKKHWAYRVIKPMVNKGILNGYEDNTFRPGAGVSREEFAIMFANSFNLKPDPIKEIGFLDVETESRAAAYIKAVKPYFPGKSGDKFCPDQSACRENVVAAIVKIKKTGELFDNELKNSFEDFSRVSSKLKDFIAWARINQLARGYPDNTFRPRDKVSRAEAAALLNRAVNLKVAKKDSLQEEDLYPFSKTQKGYEKLAQKLKQKHSRLYGYNVDYYIKKLSKDVIYVFVRVDKEKYFSFNGEVYKKNAGILKDFAREVGKIAAHSSKEEKVILNIGYTLSLYYNPENVYEESYITYIKDRNMWKINRFYAGALAVSGKIQKTWVSKPGDNLPALCDISKLQ
ncbi:MAG: S-layer homology domain-containing protein [Clostridiales bacterium]|nr:S-layer homology domain-containing protein [Clostridiales bacterium]MCF8023451.1 S-layer homology domain-containing protein [Clostridiales bacterium]